MIGVDRRLVEREPNSKDRHRRLKDDLTKLANLLLDLSEPAAARDTYGEAFVAVERWLDIARDNFMKTSNDANRNDLVQAYGDAGWNAMLAGRANEALPHLEAALSLNPDTPWNTRQSRPRLSVPGALRGSDAALRFGPGPQPQRGRQADLRAMRSSDDFAIFRRLGLTLPEMARAERELKL